MEDRRLRHHRAIIRVATVVAAIGLAACAPAADAPVPAAGAVDTAGVGAANANPAAPDAVAWSRFRGPNGSGVVPVSGIPTEFGEDLNVVWRAELPAGRSSPIVVGERIYVTGHADGELVTVALDADSGEIVWSRAVERARDDGLFRENEATSPTPASDGTNLYVFFTELGVLSYDADGNERWRHDLGPFDSFYGLSGSPLVAGGLVLVLCDQVDGSFLLALDKDTGEQRWRAERPGRVESWTTPVLYPADEPREIVVFGSGWVDAYELDTGAHVWQLPGVGEAPVASPVVDGSMLVVVAKNHAEDNFPSWESLLATADGDADERLSREEFGAIPGWGEHFGWADRDNDDVLTPEEYGEILERVNNPAYGAVGIRLPAAGSGGEPEIVWQHQQSVPYIASPLVYGGLVYLVRDGGIVQSLDLDSGELIKRGRTSRSAGSVYSSPVAAEDKIIVGSLEGEIAVLQAAGEWEVLALNEIDEAIYASPALGRGRIYVRTPTSLYAFGGTD